MFKKKKKSCALCMCKCLYCWSSLFSYSTSAVWLKGDAPPRHWLLGRPWGCRGLRSGVWIFAEAVLYASRPFFSNNLHPTHTCTKWLQETEKFPLCNPCGGHQRWCPNIFPISKLLRPLMKAETLTHHQNHRDSSLRREKRNFALFDYNHKWCHAFAALWSQAVCKPSWLLIYFFWVESVSFECIIITVVCKIIHKGHTDMLKRLKSNIDSTVLSQRSRQQRGQNAVCKPVLFYRGVGVRKHVCPHSFTLNQMALSTNMRQNNVTVVHDRNK